MAKKRTLAKVVLKKTKKGDKTKTVIETNGKSKSVEELKNTFNATTTDEEIKKSNSGCGK